MIPAFRGQGPKGFSPRLSCCFLILATFLFPLRPAVAAEDWQEVKGENFVVFYLEDPAFAQEVLTQAERYYQKIAFDLGYSRYDNFWQWENRAKIYIYRNHGEFLKATGKNPWIHGTAFYNKKEIISYKWGQGFLEVLLPHELCHLIFRDFVGFKGEVPLWLDEGVAEWEEAGKRKGAVETVKALIAQKEYIPLKELMRVGSDSEKDPVQSAKLYAQAATLVGYLMETYGSSSFGSFCRELRDGKSVGEALAFVYTDSIQDVETLEKKWLQHYGGS